MPNKSYQNLKLMKQIKANLKATVPSMMNKGTNAGIRIFPFALATRNWAVIARHSPRWTPTMRGQRTAAEPHRQRNHVHIYQKPTDMYRSIAGPYIKWRLWISHLKFRRSDMFLLSHEVSQKYDGLSQHNACTKYRKIAQLLQIERNTHMRRALTSLLFLLTEGKSVKKIKIPYENKRF